MRHPFLRSPAAALTLAYVLAVMLLWLQPAWVFLSPLYRGLPFDRGSD